MVVLFQQYIENICFSFNLSAGGLCDWGILLVISLEFQGNKASTVFYDTAKINSLPAESLSPVFAASCMVRRFIGFTAWWSDSRFSFGCVVENGWCFFPWSAKGITEKMPYPWLPPYGTPAGSPLGYKMLYPRLPPKKGKNGEKVCIFTALWRWNNHKPEQGLSFLGWAHDWAMLLAISLEL